jgi:AcrR family transcriptional regulator
MVQSAATVRRTQTERRDEAEQRLFKAAVALVAERGLERITLADVGEAAGYSRGLPAHYFGSKAGMIVMLAERLINGFGHTLAARSEHHTPGLARLLGAVRFYLDSAARDRVATKALFVLLGDGLSNPLIREPIARLNASGARSFASEVRAGIAAGEVRPGVDPAVQGLLLLAQLRGAVGFWLLSPETIDLAQVREEVVASVTRNLAL